jgi:predicted Rossmann fold flavoprotein
MSPPAVIIVGGGAAGCFAAIACAEAGGRVTVLERSPSLLGKVRVSGGGRCNVTHACFDPRELAQHYPRGGRELIGAFTRFQPADTVSWFQNRGVELKAEEDGRMFPATDSSQTIIDCLLNAARRARVELRSHAGVASVAAEAAGGFAVSLEDGRTLRADRVMLATGGCRGLGAGRLAGFFGHTVVAPVPSLFTFHIASPWLRGLAGVAVAEAAVAVPGTVLAERGPVLITHWGLSGPAILRVSAWGARVFHNLSYRFPLVVNWLPGLDEAGLSEWLTRQRQENGARRVENTPCPPLPARLWEQLARAAGLAEDLRWAATSREQQRALQTQLQHTILEVSGRSLNKDEFVTCGGVKLSEVDLKTMESRRVPGLFFGGELLDIDGLTGGFNFQAAWTTGWLAGNAMAGASRHQG